MVEEQLTRHGFDDVVTGLPSRSLFLDRLEHAVSRVRRRDMVGVLLIDLERADGRAHGPRPLGDELLVMVGRRLELTLRPGDTLARLGGDEFTILLEDLDEVNDVATICERVIGELARPFVLRRGEEAYVTVTIGASFGTTGRTDAGEILRSADAALHRARIRGENRYVLLAPP